MGFENSDDYEPSDYVSGEPPDEPAAPDDQAQDTEPPPICAPDDFDCYLADDESVNADITNEPLETAEAGPPMAGELMGDNLSADHGEPTRRRPPSTASALVDAAGDSGGVGLEGDGYEGTGETVRPRVPTYDGADPFQTLDLPHKQIAVPQVRGEGTGDADRDFRHDAVSELAEAAGWDAVRELVEATGWKALEYAAHLMIPGSGQLVKETYRAVQIISAVRGALVGDGYVYQIGLMGNPAIGGCIVLRIRQAEARLGNWPRISVGFDINFLDGLDAGDADIDGRDRHRLEPAFAVDPRWAGDWMLVYGMRAVRDHQAVLDDRGVFATVGLWAPKPDIGNARNRRP
jgi:hypothetical protein